MFPTPPIEAGLPEDPSAAKDLSWDRQTLGSAGRGRQVALSHGKELPCKSKALFCVQTHVKKNLFQREIYLRQKKKGKNIKKKRGGWCFRSGRAGQGGRYTVPGGPGAGPAAPPSPRRRGSGRWGSWQGARGGFSGGRGAGEGGPAQSPHPAPGGWASEGLKRARNHRKPPQNHARGRAERAGTAGGGGPTPGAGDTRGWGHPGRCHRQRVPPGQGASVPTSGCPAGPGSELGTTRVPRPPRSARCPGRIWGLGGAGGANPKSPPSAVPARPVPFPGGSLRSP